LLLSGFLLMLQQAAAATEIVVPRYDEAIVVDGVLDEDVWARAAVIDGFWQYDPADGRPAVQRTEVRVWYAPDAIHFGIVAHDSEPQAIRATRADRDHISGDDHVIIYLDTFLDRRRAFFFGVNPLGIQQDGVRTEGAATAGRMFGGSIDTSPDFLFESRGTLTPTGYTVEVRIPFKSLRYPAADVHRWGLNIERKTQRTGFVDAWPETRRASASFLAQGGVVSGMNDLRRGVVFEAQPFATVNVTARRVGGEIVRDDPDPALGANLRFGFTSISLDATVNPDFSQIEADAGLITVNERFALFVPEKRPFFLEGIELFATPNQLVYTRQIAEPRAGGKVTGKVGALGIAHLTALDRNGGEGGGDALFNVTRLRRDIGASSIVGLTLTDRSLTRGSLYNRIAAGDTRIVFNRLYYFEGQLGGSWTRRDDGVHSAPIWKLELDRTGRAFGFNYQLNAVGEDFESHAGFVNRSDIVSGRLMNRVTWFGRDGGTLERITVFSGPTRIWTYSGFGRDAAVEGSEFVNASVRLRGDWELTARVSRDFVRLDASDYAHLASVGPDGPRPYEPLPRVSGPAVELGAGTPVFRVLDARATLRSGRVAIFSEGGEGNLRSATATLAMRPDVSIRLALSATYQALERALDGTEFARTVLPRLRAEFQPVRSFFLRGVAEYRSERRSALRDARTGDPLAQAGAAVPAFDLSTMRFDLLASYQPVPGTVAFIGYGASLDAPDGLGVRDLSRSADGLFIKLAYQIRR
jgi:hypothetical protein